MLKKVESTSDANCGPEPCQSGTALTFQFYALPTLELSLRLMVQCGRMRMRMTTITLRIQNLTLSSLKINDHPTNIHTSIYTIASCLSCIRGSLRLAPNYFFFMHTSIFSLLKGHLPRYTGSLKGLYRSSIETNSPTFT